MSRILSLVLVLMFTIVVLAFAEDMDLRDFTDAELDGLERAIAMEREARSNAALPGEGLGSDVIEEQPDSQVDTDVIFEALRKGEHAGSQSVINLQGKLVELGYLHGRVDGIFGPATETALKKVQGLFGWETTGEVNTNEEFNAIMALGVGDGKNLALGTSAEWSDWMRPESNLENRTFNVSYAYLCEMQIGDPYTCQVEIEFHDVSADKNNRSGFGFIAQGAVDGAWNIGNVWNERLVQLTNAPQNGVYRYTATSIINEKNVSSGKFDLGFRCDYWGKGEFRVRKIKVEKGAIATEWCVAEDDKGDGVNLAIGSNSEWSEWMTPESNLENRTFNVANAYLTDKRVGESYTCQVEIEFNNVNVAEDYKEQFSFLAQGAVDGVWNIGNVWDAKLVHITEAPSDGVYQYIATSIITDKNVNATAFDLGFRCDYWLSGSFRVKNVKIEKGAYATEWSTAP